MELLIQIPEAFKWSWIRRNTVSFNKKIPLLKEKANKQHFLQTFGALLWLMTLLVWNHWNSQFPIFHCKEPITKLCVCVCVPCFPLFVVFRPPPEKKKETNAHLSIEMNPQNTPVAFVLDPCIVGEGWFALTMLLCIGAPELTGSQDLVHLFFEFPLQNPPKT